MTGIAGYVNRNRKRMGRTLDDIAKSLRYAPHVVSDKWKNDCIGVCRVHHGVTNRKPQPIFNQGKSLFILMDGEVFHNERRTKPASRRTDSESDTMVHCLDLYGKMGDEAFKQLNGSFSIAIYDFPKRELLLVADRFCSRPLFYSVIDDGSIFFGSKLSSVLVSPEVSRELNISSIFEFLTLQMVLGTKTWYKNIHVVPPGSVLHYRNGQVTLNCYWRLQYKAVERPEQFYVDKLAQTLKSAVETRTDDCFRYGILLSGGLDSRAVLAATTKKVSAYTFSESENREVKLAREVACAKGCEHKFLQRPPDHYINILDKAVELSDGLYAFWHSHFIDLLDPIREECEIILHGCYLDNFKGFSLPTREFRILGKSIRTSFLIDTYLANLSENEFSQVFLEDDRFVNQMVLRHPEQVFTPTYSKLLGAKIHENISSLVKEARERGATSSDVWDYIITWHVLSKQRTYLHLSHIRAFMPERTMMFDNGLFDLYLQIPVRFKRNGRVYRKTLKALNQNIAHLPYSKYLFFGPQTSASLESILDIIQRSIQAISRPSIQTERSWPNLAELLRQNPRFMRIVEETIMDPECLDPSIFNTDGILRLLKDHIDRKANHFTLLTLILTFGRWNKKYGDNAHGSPKVKD